MTQQIMPLMDAASLHLEGQGRPMHVAGLLIFELPAELTAAQRQRFVTQLVSRWRRERRVSSPWNRVLTRPTRWQLRPATTTCYDLDLEYHLRQWSLPGRGEAEELAQMIAWLHGQSMDLAKPLWECHVIEGLANNRFALYVKLHHALVDGISATRLLMRGLATNATDRAVVPPWAAPQPPLEGGSGGPNWPSGSELVEATGATLKLWGGAGALTTFQQAPRSIVNGAIGQHRRMTTQHFRLDRLKAVAQSAEATLNDVVLALVGGALRRYLLDADALPEASLTAAMPVSTRKPGDFSVGNQVSMTFGCLGTNVADPRARLERIKASTRAGKSMVQGLSMNAQIPYALLSTAPFLASVILGRAGKGRPLFNTVVSNVPGDSQARYLDGARLLHCYPVSLVMPGVPLNFTCFSHDGYLNLGIVGCRDRVPRLKRLSNDLAQALEDLEKAVSCS